MISYFRAEAAATNPTRFHEWLESQARAGGLRRVYTQNIDDIETKLPNLRPDMLLLFYKPWARCVQLHGSIGRAYCTVCHGVFNTDDHDLWERCPRCAERNTRASIVGTLLPRIRLYGQDDGAVDDEAVQSVVAKDVQARLDGLLVVGTSLKVPGAIQIVLRLLRSVKLWADGGVSAWVNTDVSQTLPSSLKESFDLNVNIEADELAELLSI